MTSDISNVCVYVRKVEHALPVTKQLYYCNPRQLICDNYNDKDCFYKREIEFVYKKRNGFGNKLIDLIERASGFNDKDK